MREVAIQEAIFNALSAAYLPVTDNVIQADDSGDNTAFPYVVIGEDSLVEFGDDTMTGADAEVVIHVWSRHAGRKEVKELQAQIFDALHQQEIVLAGYQQVLLLWESSDSFLDVDGKTRQGISRFRYVISEVGA